MKTSANGGKRRVMFGMSEKNSPKPTASLNDGRDWTWKKSFSWSDFGTKDRNRLYRFPFALVVRGDALRGWFETLDFWVFTISL